MPDPDPDPGVVGTHCPTHLQNERSPGAPPMSDKVRFTVVVSHPIHYYTPFYRALAARSGMDVHAIFCSRLGLDKTLDRDMGVELSWKTDLLAGYLHEFLPEAPASKPSAFARLTIRASARRSRGGTPTWCCCMATPTRPRCAR